MNARYFRWINSYLPVSKFLTTVAVSCLPVSRFFTVNKMGDLGEWEFRCFRNGFLFRVNALWTDFSRLSTFLLSNMMESWSMPNSCCFRVMVWYVLRNLVSGECDFFLELLVLDFFLGLLDFLFLVVERLPNILIYIIATLFYIKCAKTFKRIAYTIFMNTCHLMGGLGNQLFQICATISYAMRRQRAFQFLNVATLGGGSTTVRLTYWRTLLRRLSPFLTNRLDEPIQVVREKSFSFSEIPLMDGNVMLYGYFQSYRYVEEHYDAIARLIGIDEQKRDLLLKLGLNETHMSQCVSMHFRIGDYKHIQQCYSLLSCDYYIASLRHIQRVTCGGSYTVLYFCEDVDIGDVTDMVRTLEKEFPTFQFQRGEKVLADWEQMLLMSCCRHHIIANSSFSWWGAYMDRRSDSVTCYPSTWFGPALTHDTRDLCPPHWQKIALEKK